METERGRSTAVESRLLLQPVEGSGLVCGSRPREDEEALKGGDGTAICFDIPPSAPI